MANSNEKETEQKDQMANENIRQQEDELFARMAKGVTPMAPDSQSEQPEAKSSASSQTLPWEHRDALREEARRRFPGLTDSDLDELMM